MTDNKKLIERLEGYANGTFRYKAYRGPAPEGVPQLKTDIIEAARALRATGGEMVEVKALVWSDDPSRDGNHIYREGDAIIYWTTDGNPYRIKERLGTERTPYSCTVWYVREPVSSHGSMEEARAGAQTHHERRIRAALSTPDGWQSMETAPGDEETPVLLWLNGQHAIGLTWRRRDGSVIGKASMFGNATATHWQPLPAAPTQGAEE